MSPARTINVTMAAQNHRIVHQSPAYPRTKPVLRIHQKPRIITRYDERENSRRADTRSRFRSFASRNPTPEETPWAIRNTNTPKMCTNTIQSYTTGSSAMRTSPRVSEKALNMRAVVDVHAQGRRLLAEAWHTHDVARNHDEEACACGGPDPPDFERPTSRGAEDALVVAQAELGLRDADGERVEVGLLQPLQVVQRRRVVLHIRGAVDRGRDLGDLLLEAVVILVNESDRSGRGLRRVEDEPREFLAPGAAVFVTRVRCRTHPEVLAVVHDPVDFLVRVRRESVHCDDRREAEGVEDLDVGIEVREAGLERLQVLDREVFLLHASVVFQRPHARDEDRGIGPEPALAAYEVHELLAAEVRAEPRFRHDDLPETQGQAVREDAAVPVRDVRKRPAMNERGGAFEGLHQVRQKRVFQEDRGRTVDSKIADFRGPLSTIERDDDSLESCLQVVDPFREAEDRHHLARGRDDEPVFPRHAVLRATEARDDVPELAVVHVEASREQDPRRIDVEHVPVEDVGVHDGRDQVVRGADRVDVPREVEVDFFHRQDLGPPSTGGSTFRAEHGPEGRLPNCDDRLRAEPIEGLAEADRREGLPFSIAGRGRARYQHELALAALPRPVNRVQTDLRDVIALEDEVGPIEADRRCDFEDGPHRHALSNLDIGHHGSWTGSGEGRINLVRTGPSMSDDHRVSLDSLKIAHGDGAHQAAQRIAGSWRNAVPWNNRRHLVTWACCSDSSRSSSCSTRSR